MRAMPAGRVKPQAQRKKKPPRVGAASSSFHFCLRSFDDFNNASGMGVHQNRLIVDHGVTVLPNAILRWNVE